MTKKWIIGTGVLSTVALPLLAIVSCSDSNKETIKSKWDQAPAFKGTKSSKKLGFVVADPENPRWQKSKKFLEINGKAAFKNALGSINKKASEQIAWIKANENKFDTLIIGAQNASVYSAWTDWDQTKPVVAFDRLIKTNERNAYNWYVTYDNSLVGKMQGIAILNHIYKQTWNINTAEKTITDYIKANQLDSAKIIMALAGSPSDNNAKLFFDGAKIILKLAVDNDSNFKFNWEFSKVAQDGWDYSSGQTFIKAQIGRYSDSEKKTIAAILAPNDGMAIAVINALNQSKLDPMKIFITGQDSNDEAIFSIAGKKNSGQDMTIAKPDSFATAITVALAKTLLTNTNNYNVAPDVLTGENKKAILDAIKVDFPGIDFKYDGTSYETSAGKKINTIILTPQIVTKENIGKGKLFEIVK